MKYILKKLVLKVLKSLARRRIKKFRGKIIAVTGSVGKTSTKDAIFTVLNTRFKVKGNKKSMNSDFGLMLTILDIDSGFSSATKWSWYLLKALFHSLFRDHSEILLLEFGVDKPGDMDFLTSVVKPHIAVFTNVSYMHLEEDQFQSLEEIFEEKSKLIKALRKDGVAILNIDNEFVNSVAKGRKKTETVTFGNHREADFWASQIKQSLDGVSFTLHHDNKRYNVETTVIGEHQIYVLLPAIICGALVGIPIETSLEAVKLYTLPPGRMSVIPAIKEATMLDSSYNSSPAALKEALNILKELGDDHRKVAVLGNMNELGAQSKALHELIGEKIPDCVDFLITVGSNAGIMADMAIAKGMDEKNVHKFKTTSEAAEFFKDKIKKKDLILVKGSQNNIRLERFVKKFMEFSENAKELLVRQERVWEAKL